MTRIGVSSADNTTASNVGSGSYRTLASYEYEKGVNNGRLSKMTYGNGQTVNYEYDIFDRTTKETYNKNTNNEIIYNYAYDASGALAKQYSTNSSDTALEEYRYEYDSLGRLIRSSEYNNNAFTQRTEHIYDESDRLTQQTWYNGSGATSQTYAYSDTTGLLTELETSYPGNTPSTKIDYSYNGLNMLSGKTVSAGGSTLYSTSYEYRLFFPATNPKLYARANQVSKLSYNDSLSSLSRQYTYDGNGNIASEKNISGSVLYSYTYDGQNQLTQAVYPDGTTYSYEYDTVGNIRSKKINNGTPIYYTYGDSKWADLLTKYDGHEIKYDDCGNPTKYYNGKTWNMEWSKGRELSRITRGSKTWDFTYDMAGVRSGKTVTTTNATTGETSTTEYKYTTLSGKLVRVEYNTTILDIVYDESGNPFSIRYKSNPTKEGVVYYYVLNVQGDVVGLLNSSGELVVEYKYDPWGKLLETKIGVDESNAKYDTYNNMALRNPLRYRGYIYDRDTGLYYLQSRYYDPTIGRFINADNQLSTGGNLTGLNLFAYCGNNPVNRIDPTGEAWWHWALGAVVVVACAAATIVTCGGSLAAAATAVGMVASGGTAFTTASTVAAGAFIGSASMYGTAALTAASDSRSVKEFNDKGNWGTVAITAGGAVVGGGSAYFSTKNTPTYNLNGSKDSNYVSKRGWNDNMINNAIKNGKQGTSINMANGAPCTAYLYPGTNNQYVVIENESRSIVQVSNFHDSGWVPDSRIVWAP